MESVHNNYLTKRENNVLVGSQAKVTYRYGLILRTTGLLTSGRLLENGVALTPSESDGRLTRKVKCFGVFITPCIDYELQGELPHQGAEVREAFCIVFEDFKHAIQGQV